MAVFPDIGPVYEYKVVSHFRTLRLGLTDGDFLQLRKKRVNPLHEFIMRWDVLTAEDERTLWNFYQARSGGYESFAFFDFIARAFTAVSIGTGDGSTTTFDLVAKEVSGLTVKLDGTPTAAYTLQATLGTNGQDRIVFDTAPTNGQVITADYTGKKYYPKCIFTEDDLDSSNFTTVLHRMGISIIEVIA